MSRKHDVFFSYARKDAVRCNLVKDMYERMTGAGLDVWMDVNRMSAENCSFSEEIATAIRCSDKVLLFVGSDVPASAYVQSEIKYAQQVGCKIYPILYSVKPEDMDRKFELVPKRYTKKNIYDFTTTTDDNAREALITKVIESISTPVVFGKLSSNFKGLPPDYIPRNDYIVSMEDHYFSNSIGVSNETVGGFIGRPGIGKSVMANAFCRDAEIRSQFSDGILWLDIKESGNLRTVLYQLRAEHPEIPNAFEEDDTKRVIRDFFTNKNTLVVLDDVWENNINIVGFFYDIFSCSGNRLLVTSRNTEIVSVYTSNYKIIDQLTLEEAEAMMLRSSNCSVLDDYANKIIEKFCGHTLSIAIACAMHRDGIQWSTILKSIDKQHEYLLRRSMPGYEYHDAYSAIAASVNALGGTTNKYYSSLAVIKKSNGIPLDAAMVLWKSIDPNIDRLKAQDIVFRLRNKCLLNYDEDTDLLYLHDLEYDYLRYTMRNIDGLHKEFVEVYSTITGGDWLSGPDDGYYFQNIVYHMLCSKEYAPVAASCLSDYRWLKKKLAICGCSALLQDFAEAKTRVGEYEDLLDMIGTSIFLSADFLSYDYRQLPTHLTGRLLGFEDERIIRFLEQIVREETDFWLRPTARCMLPPNTNLLNQWSIGVGVRAIAASADRFVVASNELESTVILYDIKLNESIYTWHNFSKINSLYFDSGEIISADECGNLLSWKVGDPNPTVLFSTDKSVIFVTKLSFNKLLCVTKHGEIYIDGYPIAATLSPLTLSYTVCDNVLYTGCSDGKVRAIDLSDLSESEFIIAEGYNIDRIAVHDQYIAAEATDKSSDERERQSKIIIANKIWSASIKEINCQNNQTSALHFVSNDTLLYSDDIMIRAYDISTDSTRDAAINEHWIINSSYSNNTIICVDYYGRISCFDSMDGSINSFNVYDSYAMRTMISTDCFGSLKTGIRGVPVRSAEIISDPQHRSISGINPVTYCLALTPDGIVYADKTNGVCFFGVGEKQPIKTDDLPSKPLCAVCYKGYPLIGFEDGSVVSFNNTLDRQLFCSIPSEVNILCTDDDTVFCASRNILYKIGIDGNIQSIKLPECITHISTAHGHLVVVYGNNRICCFDADDMREEPIQSADVYNADSEVTGAVAIAGSVVFFTADGAMYRDVFGDYQIKYATRHNKKERKVICLGDKAAYCTNLTDGSFVLRVKKIGERAWIDFDRIISSSYQTLSIYGDYLLAGSQRDEIGIWDISRAKCLRKISTDSILRAIAYVAGHIAFVSGRHIFWLKIENKENL